MRGKDFIQQTRHRRQDGGRGTGPGWRHKPRDVTWSVPPTISVNQSMTWP